MVNAHYHDFRDLHLHCKLVWLQCIKTIMKMTASTASLLMFMNLSRNERIYRFQFILVNLGLTLLGAGERSLVCVVFMTT